MKKYILCFFAVTLCCWILISGCHKEENVALLPEAVSIVVATDIHYLSPDLTDGGIHFIESIANGDGKVVQRCFESSEVLTSQFGDKRDVVIGYYLTEVWAEFSSFSPELQSRKYTLPNKYD